MAPKVILKALEARDADKVINFLIPTVPISIIPPIVNKSAANFLLNSLNLSIFFSDNIVRKLRVVFANHPPSNIAKKLPS